MGVGYSGPGAGGGELFMLINLIKTCHLMRYVI